jgi:alpha-1,3-rhamnosyltransferase
MSVLSYTLNIYNIDVIKMTEKQPLVSIVIPCYNHAQFVQETIQSVIDQDYENIELIIIDDGSNDSSVEVIQEMIPACEERFVRFEFRHRSNKGLSKTLNESLIWCKGEYYFPLASDDIIYPSIITKEVALLERRAECGMCHAHAESIYSKPDVENDRAELHEFTFQQIINKNRIYAPTAMIRMSVLKELGGFDEELYIEDWDMWLRLLYAGYKIGFINEVLAFYRQHENNSYKNHEKMEEASDFILNKWIDSPYYEEARLNEMLHRFNFYSEVDKLRSLKYLPLAIKNINKTYIGIIKLIIPNFLYPMIRRVKARGELL